MTKEQAIEICNKIIQQNKEIVKQTRLNKDINAMQLTANCDNESLAIETVLSMLKENSAEIVQKNTELAEKNTEIERLEKVLDEKYIFVTEARTVYARLMSLDKEDIVKNDLALRNEIYQLIEDNDKKDKIIDLMAEEIKERKYVFTNKTKKEIKQYYERKSEE